MFEANEETFPRTDIRFRSPVPERRPRALISARLRGAGLQATGDGEAHLPCPPVDKLEHREHYLVGGVTASRAAPQN